MTDTPVVHLQVTIDVPLSTAVNAVVGAMEGGYSPWIHSFHPTKDPESIAAIAAKPEGEIWYSSETFWRLGGRAVLTYDGPEEEEGEGESSHTVDLLGLSLALNRMNKVAPRHFADLVGENDDAITHDVFMQMTVFEEIIYG